MRCARERRPQAGSPDARADAVAGGGRGRIGRAPGGCRRRRWGWRRGTVYGWLARYREGGKDALKARPVPGRPPKLTGEQMRTLYTMIVGADPRQYEFEFALWTRDLVRHVDPPRVQRGAVGGQRGPAAAHPGAVAAAAAVAGLAGRPRGGERGGRTDIPGHPRAGQGRGGHDLLRRRGRASARTTTPVPPGRRSGRPRW